MNKLFLIIGPTASGKTTIADVLIKEKIANKLITCTTRDRRDGEIDGVDYFFMSKEEFKSRISKDEFIEHAQVFDNYYGVNSKKLNQTRALGRHVIGVVDVQGAKTFKEKMNEEVIVIFLEPENTEELRARFELRGESMNEIESRLRTSIQELETKNNWDHLILNKDGELDSAIKKIKQIISEY